MFSERVPSRQEYLGKPQALGTVADCLYSGVLSYDAAGNAVVRPQLGPSELIPPSRQLPVIDETVKGLATDLAPGSDVGNRFRQELKSPFDQAFVEAPDSQRLVYGELFYYPQTSEIAALAPRYWHTLALMVRNSLLIRDAAQQISLEKQREIFRQVVIGSAGASVGKNAWLSTLDTLNPDWAKIADPRTYKITNARRTHLGMRDVGKNKAEVAALQAHEVDPYLQIAVYSEGLSDANIANFLNGDKQTGEPAVDFIIEETDDPFAKVKLRQAAREQGKILLMITDIGVAYQVDIRNWRDNPNLPLTYWSSDKDLLKAQAQALEAKNRESFLQFAWAMIGFNWQEIPEFRDLITEKLDSDFTGGIPQLGIAAYAGGAHVALDIALMSLGNKRPESTFVDLRSHKILCFGQEL